ncbi:bromodomain-containing protein 4-like protein isoform X3 [Cinnamomum micranthum f. kanehirae]|uniref:Bromodomain-containing protein 4-like protein isoform X3 n=1 Tax=Cinnamomum micranthum f. kanehirae TaxID=337451 RepID=A0A3S3RCA6_9MAGN|nr:bromodomain-containing protein 4-like protein isoform X3 [Cinnamomum micranthum f. kanehirae]
MTLLMMVREMIPLLTTVMEMEMVSLLTLVMIKIAGRSSQSSSIHPRPQPTESGSSEIQSEPACTEVGGIGSSSNPISGKKRTRGSSRGIKLFNRLPDDKLIVQFNAEGQPIGDNARPFATLCGIIVRTPGNAPLQVTKWADVLEQSKEKMWKHIQDYAMVDDERKKWVLQSLGKKYRDYRKDIKDKYYSPWNTDDERLQHRPPDVSSEDYAWLVQYWGSPEVQAVASKNKANRSSQKLRHRGGTKSFARHRDEETRSRTDGSIPTRADLFIRTHSRKDGTPVDEKSTEIISKFKELSAAQEGGSSSSIGDDIYTQVMGAERHGRVRGYGLGPTPTSVFGSTSRQSQAAFDELQTELSSMHEKLQQMEEWKNNQEEEKRQMEEWKKNQEEEKRQMEEWKKNQEEEKRAHLEEMKLLQAIIAEMRQSLFLLCLPIVMPAVGIVNMSGARILQLSQNGWRGCVRYATLCVYGNGIANMLCFYAFSLLCLSGTVPEDPKQIDIELQDDSIESKEPIGEKSDVDKGNTSQQACNLELFEEGCILIEYARKEAACVAAHCLHRRPYGDQIVVVGYIPYDMYRARFPR